MKVSEGWPHRPKSGLRLRECPSLSQPNLDKPRPLFCHSGGQVGA